MCVSTALFRMQPDWVHTITADGHSAARRCSKQSPLNRQQPQPPRVAFCLAGAARAFSSPLVLSALRANLIAPLAGIDPEGLAHSVASYNAALKGDRPDPLGRTHRPIPLTRGPWFAVRNHGTTATPSGGLVVDIDCRVLDEAGAPIAGLFAA